ncbi:MAG: HAMP domain-containing histidine kinase [Flavipsychrobacter sp.]|nr:HAMP domain-containing histidine kinase [Flavipsychrobacter sp.]
MKIQTRITLFFTLINGSIILLLSFLVYYFAGTLSSRDFEKRVTLRATIAAKLQFESKYQDNDLYNEFRRQHIEILPEQKEYFLPLQNGKVPPSADTLPLPDFFYRQVLQLGTATYRKGSFFYAGVRYKTADNEYIVVASARNDYITQQLYNLRHILFAVFVFSTLIILLVGKVFSKRIFRSVRVMMSKVKDISAHNLHLRLDVGEGKDEVAELASTFNNMLDRLETSFETQNNFVSNASHELSTPLTVIIGEAELSLGREREPEEIKASLHTILSEAERLQHIIRSLLNLAQTGFNGMKQVWDEIRIDELIWEVKEELDNINPNNQVHIDYSLIPEDEERLKVSGNAQLLKLALSNIILNGCKYSNNAPVIVGLAATNERLIIIVKDSGVGIPAREISYIYDPFFRASNTIPFKGYGIGLPLARNIIRMHKGDLLVESMENVGTEVHITLPILVND